MKFNLSLAQKLSLFNALEQMDGREVAVATADGKTKIIEQLYKLGPARLTHCNNLEALKPFVEAGKKALGLLSKETWPDGPPGVTDEEVATADPDGFARVAEQTRIMLEEVSEVELEQFTHKLVFVDNEYPYRVYSTLKEIGMVLPPATGPS